MTSRGLFIVIEGIDGAGTTTQTTRLAQQLATSNVPALPTHQPTRSAIGQLLRQSMRTDITQHEVLPIWSTMSLLFVADRMNHLAQVIEPALQAGTTVVCDRYDYSTLAYQSIAAKQAGVETHVSLPWLQALNRFALRPDLTIVLTLPLQTAKARRDARGEHDELYENETMQAQLCETYLKISHFFPTDEILEIDGSVSIDDVAAEVWQAVEKTLFTHRQREEP